MVANHCGNVWQSQCFCDLHSVEGYMVEYAHRDALLSIWVDIVKRFTAHHLPWAEIERCNGCLGFSSSKTFMEQVICDNI